LLSRIPFYAWIRLFFLLYLILPQSQGAKVLYQEHVQPYLEKNEHNIDDFISSAHERAKAAGLVYLKQAIEFVKHNIMGLPAQEPTPTSPSTPSALSYTQSLLARFNLPGVRPTNPVDPVAPTTSTANDFYNLLASAVTAATSATAIGHQSRDLSNSGILIPPTVDGQDRLSFISAQRERLAILLSALDKEATNLEGKKTAAKSDTNSPRKKAFKFFDGPSSEEEVAEERPRSSTSGLSTRKSEADFEKIEAESGAEEDGARREQVKRAQSGSWLPWSWGTKPAEETAQVSSL
jgi:receptor expression-enhancing protein 1/2/3/4